MKRDALLVFCEKPGLSRYNLDLPWVFDGWRYATDGTVCVREPAKGKPNTAGVNFPKAHELFKDFPADKCTITINPFNGRYVAAGVCPECGQKRKKPADQKIDGVVFSGSLMVRVATLGKIKIAKGFVTDAPDSVNGDGALPFVSGQRQGLVMPRRRSREDEPKIATPKAESFAWQRGFCGGQRMDGHTETLPPIIASFFDYGWRYIMSREIGEFMTCFGSQTAVGETKMLFKTLRDIARGDWRNCMQSEYYRLAMWATRRREKWLRDCGIVGWLFDTKTGEIHADDCSWPNIYEFARHHGYEERSGEPYPGEMESKAEIARLKGDILKLNKEWAETSVRWADEIHARDEKIELLKREADFKSREVA